MPAGVLAGTSGSVWLGWGPGGVRGAGSWQARWAQYYMFSVHVGCIMQVGVPEVTTQ